LPWKLGTLSALALHALAAGFASFGDAFIKEASTPYQRTRPSTNQTVNHGMPID
jgi:hypothetical protein